MKLINKIKDKSIVGAYVNNQIKDLSYNVKKGDNIIEFGLDNEDGIRFYQRSLLFVFYIALKEVKPEIRMNVFHSLSKGLYIEFSSSFIPNKDFVESLKEKMNEIIAKKLKFERLNMTIDDAKRIYKEQGLLFKNKIIDYSKDEEITVYKCGDYYHSFYGYMLPDTSYITEFDIVAYAPGVILMHPNQFTKGKLPEFVEEPKIHLVHKEAEDWATIAGISSLHQLNKLVEKDAINEKIETIESLQEKRISEIANEIVKKNKRIVLVAGPSSSGKTTFSKRLSTALRVLNKKVEMISFDDYFVDREDTPIDEHGEYDFESIEAIDLNRLNNDLNDLLEGGKAEIPYFDFISGSRDPSKARGLKLLKNQIIIMEGIHGLNDRLTSSVFKKDKFKIYVSALTQLNLDRHNRVATTDNRLIRRIVRDSRTRGRDARTTLEGWPSVRRGEEKSIFKFQENADVVFNTALVYEINVLKKYAMPLLKEVKPDDKMYPSANRLVNILSYFEDINDESRIPPQSILREFIG